MENEKKAWQYEVLLFSLYELRQQEHPPLASPIIRGNVENGYWAVSVPLSGLQLPVLAERVAVCEGVVRKMPALPGIRVNHLAG